MGILNLWVFPLPYQSLYIGITIGYGAFALPAALWKTKDERGHIY